MAENDETVAADDSAPAPGAPESAAEPTEKEWWDDPRMPWKGKPGREDMLCWGGFSLVGIFGLVMLPLRPVLLNTPFLLAALTGSRTATVTIGALAALGRADWWPLMLVVATLSTMKFDWIFWWAGKLWGRGLVEIIAGKSPRAARNAARAESIARRWGVIAVPATYLIPISSAVIYASVAAAGMRLRTFLLLDGLGAFVTRALYIFLGYQIGKPAVQVVEKIADYSLWISLVILAGIIFNAWRQHRRMNRKDEPADKATSGETD